MSTSPENKPFASPHEILHAFAERLSPHGTIQALRLFCRADRPEQLLCMVQMDSGATAAAAELSRSFVTGSDVCTFVDVPTHFTCDNRSAGRMKLQTCSECRKQVND